MSRLTDEYVEIYLDQMDELRRRNPGEYMHERPWLLALTEIKERRAADLTSEEREALRDFRDHFGGKHYPDVINRALAALDRLLGKETP